MLRVKPPWSASVRLLDERDRGDVLAICDLWWPPRTPAGACSYQSFTWAGDTVSFGTITH